MDPSALLPAATLLLFIIDPIGNVVTVNAMLRDIPEARRRLVIVRECFLAFAILVAFLFAGNHLLGFLGVRPATLSISGGIVLFLIALRMVFPSKDQPLATVEGEPLLVPIAIPLIAGPSTLAMLLLLASREPEATPRWLAALSLAMGVSTLILWLSPSFYEKLGRSLTSAAERLAGMVLIMLSVQMLLDGVTSYLGS